MREAIEEIKNYSTKIDVEFLFFITAILLPVFGELLFFYAVCHASISGFVVFSFCVCLNLLLQLQCTLKAQHTLPSKGYKYACILLFFSLMYIVPLFSIVMLIFAQTGNSVAAVTIAMLYVYAFSFVLGISFIMITKYYKKKIQFSFIISAYVIFVASCIVCSFYADSKEYNIRDSISQASLSSYDNNWDDDIPTIKLTEELEQFYYELIEAEPSYVICEELNPVLNVGILYRINSVANIKAVVFEGLGYAEQRTKVFAYVGMPKSASAENKVPAVVLIHGAGGSASYSWVKQWTDRGYAAIAVSMFGAFPDGEYALTWNREIPASVFELGFTNSPNIDGMANSADRIDLQWMYHAVGQTIIANSIIQSFDWVDSDNVGICGISWGAVVASLAVTYDNRFSFAVPIFGSAFLENSKGMLSQCYEDEITNALWAAENRFDRVKIPIMWICGNDDVFFSPDALSQSYTATKINNPDTQFCLLSSAQHSHDFARSMNEVYSFADSLSDKNKSFPQIISQPQGRNFIMKVQNPAGFAVTGATLFYLTEEWNYETIKTDNTWKQLPLSVNNETIECRVPEECSSYYVDISFNNRKSIYNISSEYVQLSE